MTTAGYLFCIYVLYLVQSVLNRAGDAEVVHTHSAVIAFITTNCNTSKVKHLDHTAIVSMTTAIHASQQHSHFQSFQKNWLHLTKERYRRHIPVSTLPKLKPRA